MNITDYLIIYFSIGAPFGVYTYFQSRAKPNQNRSRLKTLAVFLFWLPAALRLIRRYKFFDRAVFQPKNKKSQLNSPNEKNLYAIQKRLEKFLSLDNSGVSIFEFRETIERYAGLTAAVNTETAGEAGNEFFKAAKNKNVELAAKCFYRRNRTRLFFHQTAARQDFLSITGDLFAAAFDKQKFVELTLKFVDALGDSETRDLLENFFVAQGSLEYNYFAANTPEKDIWKPQTRALPTANSISTLTQSMTNLPTKD